MSLRERVIGGAILVAMLAIAVWLFDTWLVVLPFVGVGLLLLSGRIVRWYVDHAYDHGSEDPFAAGPPIPRIAAPVVQDAEEEAPLPPQVSTLLLGFPSERRAEVTDLLGTLSGRNLLIDLVARCSAVSLAHAPLDRIHAAPERVASALDQLASRDRSDATTGFRDGVATSSTTGPGTSVLAIVFASRSAPMPAPQSIVALTAQIDHLVPLKRELMLESRWVPASEDHAFDAATLWELFPELTRLAHQP